MHVYVVLGVKEAIQMSEEKRVILPGWSENEQAEAFQKIAEVRYKKNFGRLSKADMEVLLFSIYLEHC